MNELIPATASLTTAVKNVYDITTSLISTRKQNKLISTGQLRRLEVAIHHAVEEDRQSGLHQLMVSGRNMLMDSYSQISEYANTEFGDMLLDSLHREARYFADYWDDYSHLTRPGGFR